MRYGGVHFLLSQFFPRFLLNFWQQLQSINPGSIYNLAWVGLESIIFRVEKVVERQDCFVTKWFSRTEFCNILEQPPSVVHQLLQFCFKGRNQVGNTKASILVETDICKFCKFCIASLQRNFFKSIVTSLAPGTFLEINQQEEIESSAQTEATSIPSSFRTWKDFWFSIETVSERAAVWVILCHTASHHVTLCHTM